MLAVSLQAEPAEQIFLSSLHQLIEDVKVPLSVVLVHHAGFLQQITQDVTADCTTLRGKGRCADSVIPTYACRCLSKAT